MKLGLVTAVPMTVGRRVSVLAPETDASGAPR